MTVLGQASLCLAAILSGERWMPFLGKVI